MTDTVVETEIECRVCGKAYPVQYTVMGWKRWQEGELIQTALPELDRDTAELLISGVCGPCFEYMFDDEVQPC